MELMPTNVIENHKFTEIKNALADNIKEISFYYLFLLICYLFIYVVVQRPIEEPGKLIIDL